MDKKTISIDMFNELVKICRAYDPFTMYIDDYQQMKSAISKNKRLENRFKEILEIDFGFIPCTNEGKYLEVRLLEWLRTEGIIVERGNNDY